MNGFALEPLQFQSTDQRTPLTASSNLAMLAFKKHLTHPTQTNQTEPSVRKLNSSPTKLGMLFPAHLQARELCSLTYSLSLPLEWSQVTHISARIKTSRVYKPMKSAFYSTFARQLCDHAHLPGWLSAFPVHSQTYSSLQQALRTEITNHCIQRATNISSVFWGFFRA